MSLHEISRRSFMGALAVGSGAAVLGGLGCVAGRATLTPREGLLALNLADASDALRTRALSPVELTRECLERIERLDGTLNCFITVTAASALAAARQAEHEIRGGHWRGPLHGIPIALKDNIDAAGVRTTAGSRAFAERIPDVDSDVARLLKEAGAVILGKLNMHELAVGTTNAISGFGPVRNPWSINHVSGGSSGGSAAAVAAGFCFGAVGTDTGGSIRIPASCCGIVGFKPTYGVVSTRGLIYLSESFDHIGPMCRAVGDAALMLRAMTDHPAITDAGNVMDSSRLRVGVLDATAELCESPATPEVQRAFDAAVQVLRPVVAEIREASIRPPDLGKVIEAELNASHAALVNEAPELYDGRTRETVLSGATIGKADLTRLRSELAAYRASVADEFAGIDLMISPTTPDVAMRIADADGPFDQYACTFAFSIGGLPSISVPCGFSDSGLPIGLQISGPPLSDLRVLALAAAFENATPWHKRRPPL